MSLSFREIAAIAFRVIPATLSWNDRVSGRVVLFQRDDEEAIKSAQTFAEKCCATFGHEGAVGKSAAADAKKHNKGLPLELQLPEVEEACWRCGKVPE